MPQPAPLTPADLTLYASFTVMTDVLGGRTAASAVADLTGLVEGLIQDDEPGSRHPLPTSITSAAANLKGLTYKRNVQASWTNAPLKDVQNHVVLILAANGYLAVHLTDPKLQSRVTAALVSDRSTRALKDFAPVPRVRLEDAFIADGPAKTLWLSGVHPRNALKANAKIVSGDDLSYALDVLEDQSFWWSAGRARHAALGAVVGASAKASRIWLRKTADLADYAGLVDQVLKVLAASTGNRALRVLAQPDAVANLAMVENAYDLTLMPPDFGAEETLAQSDLEELIADATDSVFHVTGRAGSPDFDVDVLVRGVALGRLTVQVTSAAGAEKVTLGIPTPKPAKGATTDPQLARIIKTLRRGEGVTIHYDSAHSISGRRVFSTAFRRIPFEKFRPARFRGIQIAVEKPDDLSRIGTQNSLFCWLQRLMRRGHLMCDDGAMEKADFIHIDDTANPGVTFFHIKGSHSADSTREVSVSAYEVVTAQAKKNLIWLDKTSLVAGLTERIRPTNQYWLNRRPSSQAAFLAAANTLGPASPRRVVVVQPSLSLKTRKRYAGGGTANDLRLDQLDLLLASAESGCRALRADFEVICAR